MRMTFQRLRIEPHENVLTFDVSQVSYEFNATRGGSVTPLFEWEVNQLDVLICAAQAPRATEEANPR